MGDIPTLTDDEAAVLRLRCSTFPAAGGTVLVDHWRSLAEKGLLISEDSKPTNLGRAALAAYDAAKRAEIRSEAFGEVVTWLTERMLEDESANNTSDADCIEELREMFVQEKCAALKEEA